MSEHQISYIFNKIQELQTSQTSKNNITDAAEEVETSPHRINHRLMQKHKTEILQTCKEKFRLLTVKMGKNISRYDTPESRIICLFEHILRLGLSTNGVTIQVPTKVYADSIGIKVKTLTNFIETMSNWLNSFFPNDYRPKQQQQQKTQIRNNTTITLLDKLTMQTNSRQDIKQGAQRLLENIKLFLSKKRKDDSFAKESLNDLNKRYDTYIAACFYLVYCDPDSIDNISTTMSTTTRKTPPTMRKKNQAAHKKKIGTIVIKAAKLIPSQFHSVVKHLQNNITQQMNSDFKETETKSTSTSSLSPSIKTPLHQLSKKRQHYPSTPSPLTSDEGSTSRSTPRSPRSKRRKIDHTSICNTNIPILTEIIEEQEEEHDNVKDKNNASERKTKEKTKFDTRHCFFRIQPFLQNYIKHQEKELELMDTKNNNNDES